MHHNLLIPKNVKISFRNCFFGKKLHKIYNGYSVFQNLCYLYTESGSSGSYCQDGGYLQRRKYAIQITSRISGNRIFGMCTEIAVKMKQIG